MRTKGFKNANLHMFFLSDLLFCCHQWFNWLIIKQLPGGNKGDKVTINGKNRHGSMQKRSIFAYFGLKTLKSIVGLQIVCNGVTDNL